MCKWALIYTSDFGGRFRINLVRFCEQNFFCFFKTWTSLIGLVCTSAIMTSALINLGLCPGSAVVKHFTHIPIIQVLNPATGTQWEKMGGKRGLSFSAISANGTGSVLQLLKWKKLQNCSLPNKPWKLEKTFTRIWNVLNFRMFLMDVWLNSKQSIFT